MKKTYQKPTIKPLHTTKETAGGGGTSWDGSTYS